MGGMPRPAGSTVSVCGVCTSFPLPDMLSFGLGGGSLVRMSGEQPPPPPSPPQQQQQPEEAQEEQQGQQEMQSPLLPVHCTVGPGSVGADLQRQALIYGGPTVTATDVAVLLGHMPLLPGSGMERVQEGRRPGRQQLEVAWQVGEWGRGMGGGHVLKVQLPVQ